MVAKHFAFCSDGGVGSRGISNCDRTSLSSSLPISIIRVQILRIH